MVIGEKLVNDVVNNWKGSIFFQPFLIISRCCEAFNVFGKAPSKMFDRVLYAPLGNVTPADIYLFKLTIKTIEKVLKYVQS